MTMKSLLTGAAAAALLTGAASAYDVVFTDTGLGPQSSSGDEITTGTFLAPGGLAEELDFSGGIDGSFHVYVEQTNDGIFTTDDVLVTVNLTNGVFEDDVDSLNLDSACSSGASLSAGGAAGSTSATFLISGIDGCDNTTSPPTAGAALGFALPIDVDGSGTLNIEVEIVTDSGLTPVDGGTAAINALNIAPAFDFTVFAGPDVLAILNATGGPYRRFGGDLLAVVLNDTSLTCDTSLSIDLAGTAIDCSDTAQLVQVDMTVDGEMSAFAAFDFEATPGVIAADQQSATLEDAFLSCFAPSSSGWVGCFMVPQADGVTPIPASEYQITVDLDLGTMFASDISFGPLDLASIVREGTVVDFAWVADRDTAIANGTTNMIRFSSINGIDARVFAEVQDWSNPAFVDPGLVEIGTVPAAGELMFDSDTLTTAIGAEWGRGDIRFTIEGREEDLTARHLTRDGRGADAELGVGNVADDLDG